MDKFPIALGEDADGFFSDVPFEFGFAQLLFEAGNLALLGGHDLNFLTGGLHLIFQPELFLPAGQSSGRDAELIGDLRDHGIGFKALFCCFQAFLPGESFL